jgi:hypothetical protein
MCVDPPSGLLHRRTTRLRAAALRPRNVELGIPWTRASGAWGARTTHRLGGWYERRHVLVVHHEVVVHASGRASNGLKLSFASKFASLAHPRKRRAPGAGGHAWFEPAVYTLIPPFRFINAAVLTPGTNLQRPTPIPRQWRTSGRHRVDSDARNVGYTQGPSMLSDDGCFALFGPAHAQATPPQWNLMGLSKGPLPSRRGGWR